MSNTCSEFANTFKVKGQMDDILLDFGKAFQKVHHKSLLARMEHYGILTNYMNEPHHYSKDDTS